MRQRFSRLRRAHKLLTWQLNRTTDSHHPVIPTKQTVSQLAKLQLLLYRHSGLDPESSAVSMN